jgi:hypothetical protein
LFRDHDQQRGHQQQRDQPASSVGRESFVLHFPSKRLLSRQA